MERVLQLGADVAALGLSGFSGIAADVIITAGELGVLALVFVETVFPPIPSEVVLSLAAGSPSGD